jgi:hypothetical protein
MPVVREIIDILRGVWRLFLRDDGFAFSVLAVFAVAAVMVAFQASAEIVAPTIALGCLTILMELRLNRRD